MITLTDNGAEKVREFLSKQSSGVDTAGLRVGVRGGGCSGFQYALAFDVERDGDSVFESHGIRLLVDGQSLPVKLQGPGKIEEMLGGPAAPHQGIIVFRLAS